ncbi:ATP-binding protein [Caproicibacter sp. BJN0012]|uniref:ATP-binding protein n=1 Tax=Caproicibacter sp. BJN0012 TaxID=3110227 RepID=UPI002E0D81C1
MIKKIGDTVIAGVAAVLILVLAYALYTVYNTYVTTVIEQQQQQLLNISRSVSTSMDLSISEQLTDITILTGTPGFSDSMRKYYQTGDMNGLQEYLLSYMSGQRHELSDVYLIDRNCKVIFKHGQYPFHTKIDEAKLNFRRLADRGLTGIGSVFEIEPHHFGMTLINSIYIGDSYMGAVIGIVDLRNIYEQYVAPVDRQGKGYLMVEDQAGNIIMHPQSQMIGVNYWQERKALSGSPAYRAFLGLLDQEQACEEGTALYRTGPRERSTSGDQDEIAAFSHMNVGDTSWCVLAVMPRRDAMEPVEQNLSRFGFLAMAVFLLFALCTTAIYRLQKKHQKLEMKAQYLKDLNTTLEELSESREQIRHYQKLQSVGALAGGVAHEFNNLLTPILGYSELLLRRLREKDESYGDVEQIHEAGLRAKEIVEQLLPFYRRENDTTAYAPVSLDAVLTDAVKMVRVILPGTVVLQERLQKTGAMVFGNATQLNQVLLNLCSNASQAMEPDGGTLTVANEIIPADCVSSADGNLRGSDCYARVTIADTGCGMSEEVLKRIFEPFFTTKEIGKGTGLGLSVVHNIISGHGGSIRVKTAVGAGSMFILLLPVMDRPAGGFDEEPPSLPPVGDKGHGTRSILALCGERKATGLLKKGFERNGWKVDARTDPQEAMRLLKETTDSYDALIVDDSLSGYRGTAFAEQARLLQFAGPIVLTAGMPDREVFLMKKRKILDDVVLKPFDFSDLYERILRLLE